MRERRLSTTGAVVVAGLILGACGGAGDSEAGEEATPIAVEQAASTPSEAEQATPPPPTPVETATPAAIDLESWIGAVAEAMDIYNTFGEDAPPDGTILGPMLASLADRRAQLTRAGELLPEGLGRADLDGALSDLATGIDLEASAATALIEAIDGGGAALEQEVAEAGTGLPFPGTSLEPLFLDFVATRDVAGVVEACIQIAAAVAGEETPTIRCVRDLTPVDAEEVPPGAIVPSGAVQISILGSSARVVRPGQYGIEFLGIDGCFWVGRPAGVSDPEGGFGLDQIGAVVPVPDDVEAWIDDHPLVDLVAPVPEGPGRAWDVMLNEGGLVGFMMLDTDPPPETDSSSSGGCGQLGIEQTTRIRVIGEGATASWVVSWVPSTTTEDGVERLDQLDLLLEAFEIVG